MEPIIWSQKEDIYYGFRKSLDAYNDLEIEIHFDRNIGMFSAYQRWGNMKELEPLPVQPDQNLEILKTEVESFFNIFRYDSLTNLFNRRLEEILEKMVITARNNDQPLTILHIDIDDFKLVNDSFGHIAGDFSLITLASIIKNFIRPADLLGRWGADEFLFFMPDTDLYKGEALAVEIKEVVKSFSFHPDTGEDFHLSVSIGVASLTELRMKEFNELLKLAKERLNKGKLGGLVLV
jgi:diguanylate cyclase (GGDEF)-like protein